MVTSLIIGRYRPGTTGGIGGSRIRGLGRLPERGTGTLRRPVACSTPSDSRSMSSFIRDGVGLPVAVALDGAGPAGRLDVHVREHEVGVDPHRRHVRHVHRVFEPAEPFRRVVDDAGRRNRHLCRKEAIARAQAARAEDVAPARTAALSSRRSEQKHERRSPASAPRGPQRGEDRSRSSFTGCKITFYAVPSSRRASPQGRSLGQAHQVFIVPRAARKSAT